MVLTDKSDPSPGQEHFDDRKMEIIMGRLLQVGVLLASFVMLIGGIIYLRGHQGSFPDYRTFQSEPQALRHVRGVISGTARGDPAAIIQLAVLLLIATPVARVLFALVAFSMERDKLFVAISVIVLAVLLVGFLRSH